MADFFRWEKLANVVATNTDNIIIAAFLGGAMVSSYTFTTKLAVLFSVTLISKLPVALFPGVSQLVEQNNIEALKKVYQSLLRMSLRVGILSSVFVLVVNERFIAAWVGADNYGGDALNFLWVYMILFDSVIRGISIFIFSIGNLKGWAIASLVETVLNLGLSLLLVNWLGLAGVAVGTAIGRTLTIGLYTPAFIHRRLALKGKEILKQVIFPTVLRSAPGVILVLILAQIPIGGMNIWFWIIGIGCVLAGGNFMLFEFSYLIKLRHLSLKEKILALKSFY